jgi:hypothetical protein
LKSPAMITGNFVSKAVLKINSSSFKISVGVLPVGLIIPMIRSFQKSYKETSMATNSKCLTLYSMEVSFSQSSLSYWDRT